MHPYLLTKEGSHIIESITCMAQHIGVGWDHVILHHSNIDLKRSHWYEERKQYENLFTLQLANVILHTISRFDDFSLSHSIHMTGFLVHEQPDFLQKQKQFIIRSIIAQWSEIHGRIFTEKCLNLLKKIRPAGGQCLNVFPFCELSPNRNTNLNLIVITKNFYKTNAW